MEYEIRNPTRVNDYAISCEWNHPTYGWIPFTAVDYNQPEYASEAQYPYMVDIWDGLVGGFYGEIVDPPEPE